MANQWLRLWHDMPTDPKWRTIARHAKQPISLVQAVYLHLLVDASRNVTRGHATVTYEDLASALDCDEQQISAILEAMQGRVLDGMRLVGWDKRQPKREDSGDDERGVKSAAQRKKEQRQREDNAMNSVVETVFDDMRDTKDDAQCHAVSRNVPLDKDTDTDKEEPNGSSSPASLTTDHGQQHHAASRDVTPPCPHIRLIELFGELLPSLPQPKPELWTGKSADAMRARWKWLLTARRKNGQRYATTTEEGISWMARFFEYVGKSDFLMGRRGEFQCTLQWLVKAENFSKVIQGNYDNREAG